jgi:hypothetical protein
MDTIDPQIAQVVAVGVAAAAMIVLARTKSLLQAPPTERCVACRRVLAAGRCPQCG